MIDYNSVGEMISANLWAFSGPCQRLANESPRSQSEGAPMQSK